MHYYQCSQVECYFLWTLQSTALWVFTEVTYRRYLRYHHTEYIPYCNYNYRANYRVVATTVELVYYHRAGTSPQSQANYPSLVAGAQQSPPQQILGPGTLPTPCEITQADHFNLKRTTIIRTIISQQVKIRRYFAATEAVWRRRRRKGHRRRRRKRSCG